MRLHISSVRVRIPEGCLRPARKPDASQSLHFDNGLRYAENAGMVSLNNGQGADDELAGINREIASEREAFNQRQDPDMGSLSPDQVFRLLYSEWGAPGSPIGLNEEVSFQLLTTSGYFRDMRTLLLAIHERGRVKATVKKNLPRSLVADLLDVTGDETARRATREVNKVINELDYTPVHQARVVCEAAGLLRLDKGEFVVPGKHHRLLAEEQGGRLYRTLFVAFFRKFNLAYLDPYGPELSSIQSCVGYSLYRIGLAAREWRTLAELYPRVFLPAVRVEIEGAMRDLSYRTPEETGARRIIQPLLDWGMLEGRFERQKFYEKLQAVRITPLYDAFFRFNI
jgi:hypothetical protein